jgi:rhodanese-related sulfurtransferase
MEKSFEEKIAEAKAVVSAISPQQANKAQVNNPNILFIDPRDSEDISSTGIIPGALNIPLNELSEKSDEDLPQELSSHTRPIITSCGAGPMGTLAAHALKQRGYENVLYIDGGTESWVNAGYSTFTL